MQGVVIAVANEPDLRTAASFCFSRNVLELCTKKLRLLGCNAEARTHPETAGIEMLPPMQCVFLRSLVQASKRQPNAWPTPYMLMNLALDDQQ